MYNLCEHREEKIAPCKFDICSMNNSHTSEKSTEKKCESENSKRKKFLIQAEYRQEKMFHSGEISKQAAIQDNTAWQIQPYQK